MPVNQVGNTASLIYLPDPMSLTNAIMQRCVQSHAKSTPCVRPFTIISMQAATLVVIADARSYAANAAVMAKVHVEMPPRATGDVMVIQEVHQVTFTPFLSRMPVKNLRKQKAGLRGNQLAWTRRRTRFHRRLSPCIHTSSEPQRHERVLTHKAIQPECRDGLIAGREQPRKFILRLLHHLGLSGRFRANVQLSPL